MGLSRRPAFACLFALLLPLAGLDARAAAYELVDLSALRSPEGHAILEAVHINAAGVVVGSASGPGPGAGFRAFRWSGGALQLLDQLPGASEKSYSKASFVDDRGAIVGYAELEGRARAVLWLPGQPPQDLGLQPVGFANATGINSSGAITGNHDGGGEALAFLWRNGQAQRIAALGPDAKGKSFTHGHAVNDRGQVIGLSSSQAESAAYVWQGGKARALPPLPEHAGPGVGVLAYGLNAAGQAVGCSSNKMAKATIPVLWEPDGTVRALFDPRKKGDGALYGCAKAINSKGTVVGETWGPGHESAFVWRAASGHASLNDLADAAGQGWPRLRATAINERDEIIGMASGEGLRRMAPVLLRPCDRWQCRLPGHKAWIAMISLAVAAAAAALFLRRRRRSR